MRKWILDALAHARLEHAIADYARGELNLGEAAARTEVSLAPFVAELDARGIDTITPAHFQSSLSQLANLFGGSESLRAQLADHE